MDVYSLFRIFFTTLTMIPPDVSTTTNRRSVKVAPIRNEGRGPNVSVLRTSTSGLIHMYSYVVPYSSGLHAIAASQKQQSRPSEYAWISSVTLRIPHSDASTTFSASSRSASELCSYAERSYS